MANFVLIPGYWLGGWAWKAITNVLREKGHAVYPVTLTGLGERVHLGNAKTDLDTHVADAIPEKLAKLIYVDSAPLPDGTAQIDFNEPEELAASEESVAKNGGGWQLQMPSWKELDQGNNLKDLTAEDKKHIEKLATPQPFNASRQKLSLQNKARRKLSKIVILTTFTAAQAKEMIDSGNPLFHEMEDPNLTFVELPTGHYPMFSRPNELAKILLAL